MGKVFCAVCKKRCKGDTLKIEEDFVHHKCFRCTECKKNLQKGGFFVREKHFYCPADYQRSFGVTCEACHAYVEGEAVTVLGKTFHTHCFRCSSCGRLFSSGERTTILDGAYYCLSCAPQVSNGSPALHATGDPNSVPPSLSPPSKSKTFPHIDPKTPVSSTVTWKKRPVPAQLRSPTPYSDSHQQDGSIERSLTNGLDQEFLLVGDHLTVQVHENGYPNTETENDKQKTLTLTNTLGQTGDPGTMDTIFSTPGQTFSGESLTFSSSERRTCPPGVDYGRHYPISYLQLAEQGFTAIMSSDEFAPTSPSGDGTSRWRSRSLARPAHRSSLSTGQRHSRRDTAPTPIVAHQNSDALSDELLDESAQTRTKANTMTTTPIDLSGLIPPVCVQNRPRRDIYVRRRELSPGSASLGSGVVGFRTKSIRATPSTLPSDTFSHRSTPNVHAKRGMVALAESLVQPRRRPDRSLSPDSAAEYWAEARRLACYPNARLPDSASLPAIERYDFPAPPSSAVVLIDKRREKRLTAQRKATDTMDSSDRDGTMTGNELTDTELSDLPANVTSKLHQIDSEIETLKRLGESSGITSALIQELQASKLVHARGPDLDPVSASRSPSANTEPGYKTRYERHVFASPSRDTRRDRRRAHDLSYRLEYSSTGGRSGTIPGCPLRYCTDPTMRSPRFKGSSFPVPRPGYTSGTLYGRAVSLPRPTPINAVGDLGPNTVSSTPRMPLTSSGLRVIAPSQLRSGTGLRPGERLLYSGGMLGSGDRTLNTDESLLTTLGGLDSQQLTHDGITSLATSALSVDGLTVCSGDDTGTIGPSSGTYCIKSGTLTGLPHTVTGLRPVSAMLKQRTMAAQHHSRTLTPIRFLGPNRASESDTVDLDSYPSVQSWLKPSTEKKTSFKIYPYAQLRLSAKQAIKGVDKTRLENYLSPEEFEMLFQMSPLTFQRLPEWKRNDLKKKVDLL